MKYGIIVAICAILGMLFFYGFYFKFKKGKSFFGWLILYRSILIGIFAMYLYFVLEITLFSRTESYTSKINLILFSTFNNNFYDRVFVLENILLFVPYGIVLFLLAKPFRKVYIFLGTGIISSLFIEVTQLTLHIGRFEVDDILTNTIGIIIGYYICRMFICMINIFLRFWKKDKVKRKEYEFL